MRKSELEKEHTIFEGEVALDKSYFGRTRKGSEDMEYKENSSIWNI